MPDVADIIVSAGLHLVRSWTHVFGPWELSEGPGRACSRLEGPKLRLETEIVIPERVRVGKP